MGRWRNDETLKSVVGATSVGAMFRQHKSWAIPILNQTVSNLNTIQETIRKEGAKQAFKSREFGELFRATLLTAIIALIGYASYDELKNKKGRSFMEEVAYRAMNDAFSFISSLSPDTLFVTPRLLSWVTELSKALGSLAISLSTGDRTEDGELAGLSQIKDSFVPKVLRGDKSKTTLEEATSAESAAEKAKNKEAEAAFNKISGLSESDQKAALVKLASEDGKLAENVLNLLVEKRLGVTADDKKIKSLGIENGSRARYLYGELSQLKTNAEKRDYLASMATKEIVTEKVLSQILDMVAENKPLYEEGVELNKTGIIHDIVNYGKALSVDPVTAFKALFTKEQLEYVKGNVVVLKRIEFTGEKGSESIAQKRSKEQGVNRTTMRLDHKIPRELGGDNSEGNLDLITTEQWKSYTPVENYLGKKVRDGELSRREAQKLILKLKNGELEPSDIIK